MVQYSTQPMPSKTIRGFKRKTKKSRMGAALDKTKGASAFAPGHLKKAAGAQSARSFAPGQQQAQKAFGSARMANAAKKSDAFAKLGKPAAVTPPAATRLGREVPSFPSSGSRRTGRAAGATPPSSSPPAGFKAMRGLKKAAHKKRGQL